MCHFSHGATQPQLRCWQEPWGGHSWAEEEGVLTTVWLTEQARWKIKGEDKRFISRIWRQRIREKAEGKTVRSEAGRFLGFREKEKYLYIREGSLRVTHLLTLREANPCWEPSLHARPSAQLFVHTVLMILSDVIFPEWWNWGQKRGYITCPRPQSYKCWCQEAGIWLWSELSISPWDDLLTGRARLQRSRGPAGPQTEEMTWGNHIPIWKWVLTRMSTSIRYESVTTAFALERACLCPFVT